MKTTFSVKCAILLKRLNKWANTEQGEKLLCTIGAIWGIVALLSICLLVMGMLEPYMGLNKATLFVAAFAVLFFSVYTMISNNEE